MPQGSRVQIVEDEMIISMEIKQKLHAMGYMVVAQAITGESAIQKAGETKPDIILMDIRLKGEMDGITAAKRIMDLYDLPIIFLTAHSDKATLERAISVSPSGYLLKPFKERELMTNIEMSLHKHRVKQKIRQEVTPTTSSGRYKELSGYPVGIVLLNHTGTIEYVNSAALQLSGYSESELTNKPLSFIFGKDDRVEDAHKDPNVQADSHIVYPDQVYLRKRGGQSVPVTLTTGLITGVSEEEYRQLIMIQGPVPSDTVHFHLSPGMTQHLMLIASALKFPAFVIDKSMLLTGHNQLFVELARKAGISQYMLNRPLFETPNFSLFADMQDIQEMFRSGDGDIKIKKFKTGETISFIKFIRIPLKKDDITTHIATVMYDVTAERHALYEAEKVKHVFAELFSSLEKLRILSQEIRGPVHAMIRKIDEEAYRSGAESNEWVTRLNTLLSELDVAWIEYADVRDQIKKP